MTGVRTLRLVTWLLPGASLFGAFACSSPGSDSLTIKGPSDQDFGKVAEVLDYSCGNLQCHGTARRNLRLYGDQGLRLDAMDAMDIPCGVPTTDAELQADYQSLVSLEPEVMSAVVADKGRHPERLTLVRKARGTEKHTGGIVFHASTDMMACLDPCKDDRACKTPCYGDRCLTSWIAGAVDVPACNNALPGTRCNPQ